MPASVANDRDKACKNPLMYGHRKGCKEFQSGIAQNIISRLKMGNGKMDCPM